MPGKLTVESGVVVELAIVDPSLPAGPRWLAHAHRCSLLTRLAARLDRSLGDAACWPFLGAHSRGGRREVSYGEIRLGPKIQAPFRVNRLVLLLEAVPDVVLAGESALELVEWLVQVNRDHRDLDAAHQCDSGGLGSRCHNPTHLQWESHQHNVTSGLARKRLRDQDRRARDWLTEQRVREIVTVPNPTAWHRIDGVTT